jgi:general L-amino acid transport system substrate-binding protein
VSGGREWFPRNKERNTAVRYRIAPPILRFGLLLATLAALHLPLLAQAGTTLATIKSRGLLRCGVSEGIPGFSASDAAGRWSGLEVDFCRALAAAVVGDPERVQFFPLKASARFPALKARTIDVLARNTTWTLLREATLKMQFPGVIFYDGQGFMVAADSGLQRATDIHDIRVCIEKGTTHELNLREFLTARGLEATLLVIDSAAEAAAGLFAGRCQAYSSDAAQLAAMRLLAPPGSGPFVILPERISKEPLSPVVRDDDIAWVTAVRWVLYALIEAEERGITRENAAARIAGMRETERRMVAGGDRLLGLALGIPDGWGLRAIQAVGNYGEIYERNLGPATPLGLERGLNRPWNQGGLMYAPPLR